MRVRRAAVAGVVALLLATTVAAGTTVIKLGTLAPDGSAWHLILKDMAQKWKEASDGSVVLRIYPGGVAGDEPDMVRKLRIGQLHAAAFTIVGLSMISPEPQALSIPMMLDTYSELDYVRDKLAPELEALLLDEGYVVLNWGDGGWVRFFSREAALSVEDVQKKKIFVWTGDQETIDVWKDAGFQPIPLAATDILSSLQTGLIDITPSTPLGALGTQTFTVATHMLDLRWAPLVGATVVSAKHWNRIPEKVRAELESIARAAGVRLRTEIRQLDDDAVVSMQKRGLEVHPVDAKLAASWRAMVEKAYPRVRGEIVPPAMFDRVKALRDEHRRTAGSGH